MPSLPSPEAPLTNGRVTLRPAAERDIPEVLIAYQDDRQLAAALGEPRPPSGATLGRRAELAEAERLAGRALVLTILEPDEDVCRGEARIGPVDWQQGEAEIRVWVAPGWRGRGLGRQAHRVAVDWLAGYCELEVVCPKSGPSDERR
jgi:RimJ/RimL family protein N-acetyltransferase